MSKHLERPNDEGESEAWPLAVAFACANLGTLAAYYSVQWANDVLDGLLGSTPVAVGIAVSLGYVLAGVIFGTAIGYRVGLWARRSKLFSEPKNR